MSLVISCSVYDTLKIRNSKFTQTEVCFSGLKLSSTIRTFHKNVLYGSGLVYISRYQVIRDWYPVIQSTHLPNKVRKKNA